MLSAGTFHSVARRAGWTLLLACSSLVSTEVVFGQGAAPTERYDVVRPKLGSREASRLRATVLAALRNPVGFGGDQKAVEDYLRQYHFPSMTLYDATSLEELAKNRERLFKGFIDGTPNATSRQFSVDMTFNYAKAMARKNFHPAVRYNAALMLGDLFERPATGNSPAVPLQSATEELIELVANDEFDGVVVPESVKLGALIGLEKHTRVGINPQLVEKLTKTLLDTVNSKDVPSDVDSEVFNWMRSKAAEALANQYKNAPTAEVQKALTGIIGDEKVELDERCEVAHTLTRLKYAPDAGVGGDDDVLALGKLTLDVVSESADAATKYQEEVGSGFSMPMGGGGRYGGGRGYGRGGYGGRGGMSGEPAGPQFERRALMDRLANIYRGAESLGKGLAESPKNRLTSLMEELSPTLKVLGDENEVGVKVTREVIALKGRVQSVLNNWGQAEAAPADEDEVDGFGG